MGEAFLEKASGYSLDFSAFSPPGGKKRPQLKVKWFFLSSKCTLEIVAAFKLVLYMS